MKERWTVLSIEAVLMRGSWFAGTDAELRRRLIAAGRIRRFGAGELIYAAGRPSHGLSAVLSGVVTVGRRDEGSTTLLASLEPGAWLGEYAALTGAATIVDIRATAETTMLWIPRGESDRLLDAEPRLWRRLAELALERYALMIWLLARIVRTSPTALVAARLVALSQVNAAPSDSANGAMLSISQRELAEMTGLSRQCVNRCLHELAAAGALELAFKKIVVRDAVRLGQVAERRR